MLKLKIIMLTFIFLHLFTHHNSKIYAIEEVNNAPPNTPMTNTQPMKICRVLVLGAIIMRLPPDARINEKSSSLLHLLYTRLHKYDPTIEPPQKAMKTKALSFMSLLYNSPICRRVAPKSP